MLIACSPCLQQRLTHHCKAIILQSKIFLAKKDLSEEKHSLTGLKCGRRLFQHTAT